jgi:cytochrome P450
MTTGTNVRDNWINSFILDPDPSKVNDFYRVLLDEAPVYRSSVGQWIISRHADVNFVLRGESERWFKQPQHSEPSSEMLDSIIKGMLSHLQRPSHTKLRRFLAHPFTVKAIEQRRDWVRDLTGRMLDEVQQSGHMDVIQAIAYRLPISVIRDLLGIAEEDDELFVQWAADIQSYIDVIPPAPEQIGRINESTRAFTEYILRLIEQRRREPMQDIISMLLQVDEEGVELSEEELVSTVFMLLIAGWLTTTALISQGILALIENPTQLELLRANPELTPSAVEECLRFSPPIRLLTPVSTPDTDIELQGVTIPAGELVSVCIAAANRDPSIFEEPNRFDITREPNRHLTFAAGMHYCLGAHLARVEGQVAIGEIVRRCPGLRLDGDFERIRNFRWLPLRSLPVSWDS